MKNKLNVITLIFFIALGLVSCSKDDDTNTTPQPTNNAYMGSWEGTFSGGDNGTWTADINKDGVIKGTLTSGNAGADFDINGNVSANGAFIATSVVVGETIDFGGQGSNGNIASGIWENSDASLDGTWSGAKK